MGPRRAMTREDYLRLDAASELRHEWVNGEVYAMSGGTSRHAAVGANLLGALWSLTRGGPCRTASSDQRIHVPETEAFLYPDAALICGPYAHVDDDGTTVSNPSVLFEVLSPSTSDFDQGAKFEHYRRLASLLHYVLIDPEQVHVIHHKRMPDGWFRRDLYKGEVVLDQLGSDDQVVRLPVAQLYEKLDVIG